METLTWRSLFLLQCTMRSSGGFPHNGNRSFRSPLGCVKHTPSLAQTITIALQCVHWHSSFSPLPKPLHGRQGVIFLRPPDPSQVLEGQERASIQSQDIADGLAETSVRLAGLSDSLSQELVSAMREIEKQVGAVAE